MNSLVAAAVGASSALVLKCSTKKQAHGRPWTGWIGGKVIELVERDTAIWPHGLVDDSGPYCGISQCK